MGLYFLQLPWPVANGAEGTRAMATIDGGAAVGAVAGFVTAADYAVGDVVHGRELLGTMLHLPGMGHARFTVEFQGLDTKLTGVEPAKPVRAILA